MKVVNGRVLIQTTDAVVAGVKGSLNLVLLFMEHVCENIKLICHSAEFPFCLSLSNVVNVPLTCSTYHSCHL